jgi:polysaccharide biosynthesis protein PslH
VKILFVALDVPYPADRGGRMRSSSILEALRAEGHEVGLVSFCPPEDVGRDQGELARLCSYVDLVPTQTTQDSTWRRRQVGRLRGLLSAVPYGAWRFRSAALKERVQRRVRDMGPDLIVWDEAYNLENLPDVGVPVALNTHDIVQVIWGRYASVERRPIRRAYAAYELRKLRRWEAAAYRRVSAVWAVSGHDAELFRRICPGVPVRVVPNAVDVRRYPMESGDGGTGILFIGGMDWFPNRDAVSYFVATVLPALRARLATARLLVVGRPPDARLRRRLEGAGVTFLGRVEDVRPVVSAAAVSVVPLRIGSGTRLKILEAAALGKATVSTRLGAEGLTFVNGSEIVLADEPTAMAAAVADLLEHPPARAAMGAAARRRVEKEYSLEALRGSLRRALAG